MKEIVFIFMMTFGVLLFSLGGLSGKWLRRFLLPSLNIILLLALGLGLLQVIISQILLMIALCMGYGEIKPYWYKFLIGIGYVLPSLLFGFSYWVFIVPVIWILLFIASNKPKTSSSFTWKIVEGIMGLLIQVTLISAVLNRW
jgi:hypothetical protein